MKFFLLFALAFSTQAFAFPKAPFDALKYNPNDLLPNQFQNFSAEAYDFEGIVKLSNCSGALVRFAGQTDSAPAFVLTNGHCLSDFVPPGQAWHNQPSRRRMMLADKNKKFHPIQAKKLVYGTMTGTDAAIYELTESFSQIYERTGVKAFYMAYQHPITGMSIDIVSGYWERGYQCSIEKFIYQLAEGGWMFSDSIKYTQPGCDTIGGTSGSPIVVTGSRFVVGVNNTGNNDGEKCSLNNPCEVSPDGSVVVDKGASYGQQTYVFYYCFGSDYQLNLDLPNCPLIK